MTRGALKAYARAVGMPCVTPANAHQFLERVRFHEQLFGPLVRDEKGQRVWIADSDVKYVAFLLPQGDTTYEPNSEFAHHAFARWREKQREQKS